MISDCVVEIEAHFLLILVSMKRVTQVFLLWDRKLALYIPERCCKFALLLKKSYNLLSMPLSSEKLEAGLS